MAGFRSSVSLACFAMCFLGGCANLNPPAPVIVMPDFNTNDGANNGNVDQNSSGETNSANDYRISKDLRAFTALPPENDVKALMAQLQLYVATWQKQSALYNDYATDFSHAQFYSALLGGISAFTKSPQGATIGAASAGISGLVSSHYQLTVQSENYSKGAQAMQCLWNEVSKVPDPMWADLYNPETGEFRYPRSYISDKINAVKPSLSADQIKAVMDGYDSLVTVIPDIRNNMDAIISNLRKSQQGVVLAAPSPTDIQSAITKGVAANGVAATGAAPLTNAIKAPADGTPVDAAAPLKATLKAQQNLQKTYAETQKSLGDQVAELDLKIASVRAKRSAFNPAPAHPGSSGTQPMLSLSSERLSASEFVDSQSSLDAELQPLKDRQEALSKSIKANKQKITDANAEIKNTKIAIVALSELDTNRISLLLLLPAAMTNCTTLTGSAPVAPAPAPQQADQQPSDKPVAPTGGNQDQTPPAKHAKQKKKAPAAPVAAPTAQVSSPPGASQSAPVSPTVQAVGSAASAKSLPDANKQPAK